MSEIFVDTIRKTGGTAGTDIRIKNTSVYESDGGTSVTQNMVQSLTKMWCHWTNNDSSAGNGTALDSFNVGTFTDVGDGASRFAFTSNMGNASYAILTGGMHDGGSFFGSVYLDHDEPPTTSQFDVDILENSATVGTRLNDGLWSVSVNGDLA